MKIALIKNGVVDNVIVANDLQFAIDLGYPQARDVTGLRVMPGSTWDGTKFTDPVPDPLLVNERTLEQQADDALAVNLQAIADAQAWIAANPGVLTTTQLSNAMRSVMQSLATAAKQRDGVIRLLRGKFDGTN